MTRARTWLLGTAGAIAVIAIAGMLVWGLPLNRPVPPPVGQVAEFTLRDQDGRAVRRADLLGAPWVANFIFTRCPGPCPLMTKRMTDLERSVPADAPAGFVTISVDPEYDTPPRLTAYRMEHGVTAARWRFLTGRRRDVLALVTKSFILPVGEPVREAAGVNLAHSERFVLVDAAGAIRGYYDSQSMREMANLRSDITSLIASARGDVLK